MGMSTHIHAVSECNENWDRMEAVLRSCIVANIEVPAPVVDYFERLNIHDVEDYDEDDINQMKDEALLIDIEKHECCSKPSIDCQDTWEIDISKLPVDTKKIIFCNSY